MLRNKLVAVLTATSTILSALISTQIEIPSYVTPIVAFVTLFIGSLFVFRRQEKQITAKLLSGLEDLSKKFHSLTMSGSGGDREIQIRFMFDRVSISDRSRKETLQMRLSRLKTCHNLIEKWFKCYEDEVEYFSKHPKLVDIDNAWRLVNEFKDILSHYLREVINASIDFMNDVKVFPKDLKERFETKFDAFKSKYNYFGNQFNDYIKQLNKELGYNMDTTDIISKTLELESEKREKDTTTVAINSTPKK